LIELIEATTQSEAGLARLATVTSCLISLALSQLVRSISSDQSPSDIGEATDFANFTAEEWQGQNLFETRGRCNNCHSGLEFPFVDLGVGGVTGREQDTGKFKMSSLRNIEKIAP
jgi:cytochrome c peroxidase